MGHGAARLPQLSVRGRLVQAGPSDLIRRDPCGLILHLLRDDLRIVKGPCRLHHLNVVFVLGDEVALALAAVGHRALL